MTTQTLSYTCPHCNTLVEVVPRSADEVVVCPTPGCGKAFQVHVPTAAPAAKLVVPENQETTGGAGDSEAQPSPPIAENLADKEEELQRIHLHMVRRYPFRFAAYMVLIAGGLILGVAGLAKGWWFVVVISAAVLGFAALRLTKWWLRMRHTTLTLTTRRCILESGLIGKETTEIPLSEVAGIQVNQGILRRLLNVGDLVIQSETGEKKQFVFKAIPNPTHVATLINNKGATALELASDPK